MPIGVAPPRSAGGLGKGGAGRRGQGCIDACASLHSHATGLEMGFDRLNDWLARVMFVPTGAARSKIVVSSGIRSLIQSMPAKRRLVGGADRPRIAREQHAVRVALSSGNPAG